MHHVCVLQGVERGCRIACLCVCGWLLDHTGEYTACIQLGDAHPDADRRCLVTPFTYLVPGSPSARDWSRSAARAASQVLSSPCCLFATSPNVRVALQQCFGLSVCDDRSQRQVSLVALHVTHDSNIAVAFDGQLVVLFECERLFGIRHFAFAEVGALPTTPNLNRATRNLSGPLSISLAASHIAADRISARSRRS